MHTISRTKLIQQIYSLKNRIFSVCWIKKNGEIRCANARTGVKQFVKGTGKRKTKSRDNLLTVYLMWNMDGDTFQAESGYRSLNLESVKWLKMGGVHYEVTPEPIVEFHDTTITQNEKATA